MARPKKMQERQRITLYIEAKDKRRLDRLARAQGRPWAEIVRESVELTLAKHRKT
jgi:predicted DNA-binding protein